MTISNGLVRPTANCKGWRTEIYRQRDANGLHAMHVRVLTLMICGLMTDQIAHKLLISTGYVKHLRSELLDISGCASAAQLGYWAAKCGYEQFP